MSSFENWQQLHKAIMNDEDRILFDDAMRAAQAGALRASYITVWLSCAESLKRKFKEASQADSDAAKVLGEIAKKENDRHAIDGFVLTKAKDFGFITDAEFIQLEDIYKQRCIYGHPYEQAPLLTQLNAAADIVVKYVLERPTKLRYGYLSKQVELICKNIIYLDDHFPAIENHAQVVYQRSSPDLHLWFLKKLWKEATPSSIDPSLDTFFRRMVWFSTTFLRQCDTEFFAALDVASELIEFPFLSQIFSSPDLFAKISAHSQDIVISALLELSKANAAFIKSVFDLSSTGVLNTRQIDKFHTQIASISEATLSSIGLPLSLLCDRIIAKIRVYDWGSQNPAINTLIKSGADAIATLDDKKQFILGNNILQAADGNAFAALELLSNIRESHTPWPIYFVEGIISECILDDENRIRFKNRYAREALLCLYGIEPSKSISLVNRIAGRVKNASIKKQNFDNATAKKQFIEAIDSVVSQDLNAYGCLSQLRDELIKLNTD